jgi:hypothetical protein
MLATVITIVNNDRKTFIVQASGLDFSDEEKMNCIRFRPGYPEGWTEGCT